MNYGDMIRKRREELGYTQAQLAELSGIDQTIISRIETGRKAIVSEQAEKILDVLSMQLELVKKVGNKKKRT